MGKIEKNMYVRTKDGVIDKLIIDYKGTCNNPNCNCKHLSCVHNYYDEDDILKVSHNIIDLIEVGDILKINNEKYEVIYDESYEKLGILIPDRKQLAIRHSALYYVFKKYNVSIVTKEQFDSMKYEVDSNE